MEKSCLMLGFYLASWGMYRGSGFLLQNSLAVFKQSIEYISTLDKTVWDIDVDNYDEATMQQIVDIYDAVKKHLIPDQHAHVTLITKILLGVFGFVPAFDQYFCSAMRRATDDDCGFRTMNLISLKTIRKFYDANQKAIDRLSSITCTTDFLTGEKTRINYTKAKIIDMYGFVAGMKD